MRVIDPTRLEEFRKAGQLPSPTGIALAILRLAQSKGDTTTQIIRIVESDAALAARVVQFANSAHAGEQGPVASVPEAVDRLGLAALRRLALGYAVTTNCRSGRCARFDYRGFWTRALVTGLAAQAASQCRQVADPEVAFACGLLAQVGRLAFATVCPNEYAELLAICGDKPVGELLRQERDFFGIDHQELSAALLAAWGLPDVCVNAVRHQTESTTTSSAATATPNVLTSVLRFASCLATVFVADEREGERLVPELFALSEQININPLELTTLYDQMAAEWHEWAKTLEVPAQIVPTPSFADAR